MNTKPALRPSGAFVSAFVVLALAAGCVNRTGSFPSLDSTKYTLENSEHFALLDRPAQSTVTCTGLQQMTTADGRLEVVANVKNRENRRVEVQVNCVFKDGQGFSAGDETPWQTLVLSENATQAVRFTAMNPGAKKYTVRVRQVR